MSTPKYGTSSSGRVPPGDPHPAQGVRDTHEEYRPAVDREARALIARIQQDPSDVQAIRALGQHYISHGDQPSLANLMEGWGDTLSDPTAAADAYLEAADAALLGGADRLRVRLLYERALSRDAAHAQALDRVLRLLEDTSDYARMKQVLKYVAYQLEQRESDPVQRAAVHYRLGQVYELRFDEPGKAVGCYRKAIEANPKLVPALAAARRIYTQVGNSQAVALLYELEIDAISEPEDKRALLTALAELRREQLDDLNGAILTLRRALRLAPGDVDALRALGDALVARSEQATAQEREIDRRRAAEVFYQLGRSVPAAQARPHMLRALELHAEHEKAAAWLRELVVASEGSVDAEAAQPALARDGADTQPMAADDVTPIGTAQATIVEVAGAATLDGAGMDSAGMDGAGMNSAEMDGARHAASAAPSPTSDEALDAQATQQRESAAAWLDEHESEPVSTLDTSELLPVSEEHAEYELRASSLPPEVLAHAERRSSHFPSRELLRAPRMPTLEPQALRASLPLPARPYSTRSVPPPPPAATPAAAHGAPALGAARASQLPPTEHVRTLPPGPLAPLTPELTRNDTSSRGTPPPAYAEIPGAATDDFGSATVADERAAATSRLSRSDPTLVAWRLPSELEPVHASPLTAADQLFATGHAPEHAPEHARGAEPARASSAVAATPEPVRAPVREVISDLPPSARPFVQPRVRVRSTRGARELAAAAPQPTPSTATSTSASTSTPSVAPARVRAALDDRLSALSRAAREQASARRRSQTEPAAEAHEESTPQQQPSAAAETASGAALAPDTAAAYFGSEPAAVEAVAVEAVAVKVSAVKAEQPVREPSQPPVVLRAHVVAGELPDDGSRAEIEVNLGATTDSNFYVGFSNRLGDGGLFVATYSPLPTGSPVRLLVTLPGGFQGRAHGRVRLTRDSLDPFSDDVPGMCVQFEAMSEDALALFERFAHKRAPLFIED